MAPQIVDLFPIVGPAISSPPFTCQGQGLLSEGYSRASVRELQAAERGWMVQGMSSHPREWWQAQLRLYGLDPGFSTTSIQLLKKRVLDEIANGLFLPSKEVQVLEKKLNLQFAVTNAEARKRMVNKHSGEQEESGVLRPRNENLEPESYLCSVKRQRIGSVRVKLDSPPRHYYDGILPYSHDLIGDWKLNLVEDNALCEKFGKEFRLSIFFHDLGPSNVNLDENVELAKANLWRTTTYASNVLNNESSEQRRKRQEKVRKEDDALLRNRVMWGNFDLGAITGLLHVRALFPSGKHIFPRAIPVSWRGRERFRHSIHVDFDGSQNKGHLKFVTMKTLTGYIKSDLGNSKFEGLKVSAVPSKRDAEQWHHFSTAAWIRQNAIPHADQTKSEVGDTDATQKDIKCNVVA